MINLIKKSKKGMTLVELIVTSIISVIIIAAAVPCLFLATDTAQSGNINLQQYESANLVEGYLKSALETAKSFNFTTKNDTVRPNTGYSFYFDRSNKKDTNTLIIKKDKEVLARIHGVYSIEFNPKYNDHNGYIVGEANTKKDFMSYTITTIHGDSKMELKGSTVLLNSTGTISEGTAPYEGIELSGTELFEVMLNIQH